MLDLDRIPTKTISPHPGEILLREYLLPKAITQVTLAKALDISIQSVNDIVKGRRGLSTETSVLLASFFGTSVGFWVNMQVSHDISKRCVEDPVFLAKIKRLKPKSVKQENENV